MAILPNDLMQATALGSQPGGQIGPGVGNQGQNAVQGSAQIGPGAMQRRRRRGILPQMGGPQGGQVRGFPGGMQAMQQRQQINPALMRFINPGFGGGQGQPINSLQPVQNPNLVQLRGRGY